MKKAIYEKKKDIKKNQKMRLGRNWKWERVRCTFEGGDQK